MSGTLDFNDLLTMISIQESRSEKAAILSDFANDSLKTAIGAGVGNNFAIVPYNYRAKDFNLPVSVIPVIHSFSDRDPDIFPNEKVSIFFREGRGIVSAGGVGVLCLGAYLPGPSIVSDIGDVFVPYKIELNDIVYATDEIQSRQFTSKSILTAVTEIVLMLNGTNTVDTVGNLAPVNSKIESVQYLVLDNPNLVGGVIDVGRTAAGNLDEFIDGGPFAAAGDKGTSEEWHDAATPGPIWNGRAETLTLTSSLVLATRDVRIKVVTWYRQSIEPTV